MRTVSIIGVGRIGGAMALALEKKNYLIENLLSRNTEKAGKIAEKMKSKPEIADLKQTERINSDIVFICTQDSQIEPVAAELGEKIKKGAFVFHMSGSLSSEILLPLKEKGCKTGSIHPLVSVSDAFLGEERFKGAYFCIEGDAEAAGLAEKIAEELGGIPFSIETKFKTLYHAAAVTACGHLVALISASIEMLAKCGLEENTAKQILLPLIKSTIDNLEKQSLAQALTGTFARADFPTFERHVETLEENASPELLEIYLLLGEKSLPLAEKQGANRENLEKIRRRILMAKKKLR
jgi:predicted short-subunit dehydrogenase-like oxidoreductase (DUF2520 family)